MIQDSLGLYSESHVVDSRATGFRIFCHWNLDSGFRILPAELSGIPESALPCLTQFLQRPSSLLVALFPHKYIQKDLLPEKSSCKSSMAYLACIPGTFQRWLMFCKLLFANKLHVDLNRDNINNQNIIELDATYDFTSRNYSNHQSINMFQEEKRDRF